MNADFKVLYLAKGDRSYPSSRYRIWQFVEPLAREGIRVEVRPLFDNRWMKQVMERQGLARRVTRLGLGAEAILKRWKGFAGLADYDLVVLEQELAPLLPFALEQHLLSDARRIAIELDDAHHLKPGRSGKFSHWFAAADGVICGNDFLASAVVSAGGRAHIVPTVVDLARYSVKQHDSVGPLRLVWLGLASNLPHLRMLEPALRSLREELDLELVVISSSAPEIRGVEVRHEAWSEAEEGRLVGACDVGLMPLPDEPWTQGKCGLKLIQYLAAGLPAIASPVGVNQRLAEGGGILLAQTDEAWADGIRQLGNPEVRAELGDQGRRSVAENWSLGVWAKRLAGVYRRLGAGHA